MEKKPKNSKNKHLSKEQKRVLLDFLRENPKLRSGKFNQEFTYKQAQTEWEEIANALNAIPGSNKNWRLWRKTWQDLQSKAKAKKASVTKTINRTGGGPQPEPLDDFEEGVVALINNNSIMGHGGVYESMAEFVEVYQEVDDNLEDTMVPPPTIEIRDEDDHSTNGERSITDVEPPPPAVESQTSDDTATNQGQESNANGKKTRTKVNMKSLLKQKVELKRILVESTINFQQNLIRIQEERNQILKDGNRK